VVANSKPTAEDIRRFLRIPDERIRLVYEAAEDGFTPCRESAQVTELLKLRYGISDKYLLFVSALYKYKRLDALIEALGVLVARGQWAGSLVVAGPDPHRDQSRLIHLARRLAVADRVKFLGSVENEHLRELYCGASVFVYPSASETFGRPVVEAMRCGAPIVAADKGSIPDIAAGAALLIDPDDIEEIANAIVRLLTDDRLRRRLRDIGLKRGQDFSWRSVAIGFSKVLEEAVA
jgi:glycosyltransferase involved in cell wall biosynthesis